MIGVNRTGHWVGELTFPQLVQGCKTLFYSAVKVSITIFVLELLVQVESWIHAGLLEDF